MPTSQALARRIATVRNRARAVACVSGAAWQAALTGGLVLLAALADWTFHFNSPAVRLGLLAAILAVGCVTAWRWVVAPWIIPLPDSAVALRVERRFPGFEERLASALQFVHSDRDAALGSPELQEQVIAETLERSERIDFRDVVRIAPVWPALGAFAGVALLAAGLAAYVPNNAVLAARRLLVPFSAPAWPRQTNLLLRTVDFQPIEPRSDSVFKIVRGHKLELLVEDQKGRLPDEVLLEYRLPGEPAQQETLRHASLRDRSGDLHDVCLLSLPADRGPVHFRALGGDDETMPELEMRVVLPPVVESLQVALTPPRYTARPAETLPPDDGHIRGVVGTHVAFRARSNKPLSSASLSVHGKPAGTVSVLADPHEFHGSFVLAEPGAYAYVFQLKDSENIENADAPRYEIEAVADLVPEVVIEEPAADTTVTAQAQVPLTVKAKDDLGLRNLQVRYSIGDNSDAHDRSIPLARELPRPEHHRASTVWRLKELSLGEGVRIVFHAEAGDWFDLGSAHVGKSPVRTLTVVSAKQKEAEIVSRQSDLLRILERAEQTESRAHEQTGDMQVQLDKAGRLKPSDVDVLKRAQADQREVNHILANPAEGAVKAVHDLLSELTQNHIVSPEMRHRLERFYRELSELRESHLPVVEEQLTRAVKISELAKPDRDQGPEREQSQSLKTARREQKVVIESLRTMLGDLTQWRDWQGVRDNLREVVEGQQKLNNETADVSRATLGKPLSELGKQSQADLARLAERQTQLAEQMDQIRRRLRETAKQARGANRQAEEEAVATLRSIEKSDPESQMREIGGQLSQNKIGQAADKQQQLLGQLRKLDQTLSPAPERDLESLVEKMKDTQQKIDTIRKDQAKLQKQTQQLGRQSQPREKKPELEILRKEQDRLREGAEETARELGRLGSQAPGERMRQAGSHMSRAGDELARGPSGTVDKQQQHALDQLDRARSALNRSQAEAEQQLAQESLVRVADKLAGLAGRQKTVIDETKRLELERVQANRWDRGQRRTLQTITRLEQQLRDEVARIAGRLEHADVYAWSLRHGADEMQAAADRLKAQRTDAHTVALETRAWSRLRDLVQAIKFTPPENGQSQADAEPSDNGRQGNAESIPGMAQLVLLKMLQQDLLHRTSEFDRLRHEGTKSSDEGDEAERSRLVTEQGELAELVERMASAALGAPEKGNPSLPSQEPRHEE